MRWKMIARMDDPVAAQKVLEQAGIQHEVDCIVPANAPARGAQDDNVAAAIWDKLEAGETYTSIASDVGVSYHTVLRVAQNPKKYGINAAPIRRKGGINARVSVD